MSGCIAAVILLVTFSVWGVSHHRALAWGLSLVLALYAVHTQLGAEGAKGLGISFERQAERYANRNTT